MESILTPQNITVTIYPVTTGSSSGGALPTVATINPITIDLAPYYNELCCFEVIAVQSADTKKQNGVFITEDKNGVIYKPDTAKGYWQTPDDYDVIEYCIRDIGSGQTAVAKITIQVIEKGLFDAVDICYNIPYEELKEVYDEPGSIDLGLINKFEDVQLVQLGPYNTKLIKHIGFDPTSPSSFIGLPNLQCNNWHPGKRTEVEYAISALVDGEYSISKAKLIITCIGNLFHAENIEIEVNEPLPAFVMINVRNSNPLFAQIAVDSVGSTPTQRGTIQVMPPLNVRYNFNFSSGFWNTAEAQDVFRYTLYNSTTGKKACAYINIKKIANSPSGSGSGSGGGSGNFETITSGSLNLAPLGGNIYHGVGSLNTATYIAGPFSGTVEYKGMSAAGQRFDILSGTFAGFTIFSGKIYSTMPPGGTAPVTSGEIYYQ
jgi:hypothetical protein